MPNTAVLEPTIDESFSKDANDVQFFDDLNKQVDITDPIDTLPSVSSYFSFPLRGNNINPMIDSCSNLLALRVRLLSLNVLEESKVNELYLQVVDEIRTLEIELKENGYSQADMLICRYCLCCAMDEMVLAKEWGANSQWAANSLLNEFHGETWGGEKFFVLLSRLSMDPKQHMELLELIYLLLCLGYKGKYADDKYGGDKEREKVLRDIYDLTSKHKKKNQDELSNPTKYRVNKGFNMQLDIPSWLIYILSLALLITLYFIFNNSLDNQTELILKELNSI